MTERSPFLSAGWGRYQTRGLSFANYDGSSLPREPMGARIGLGSAPSGECRRKALGGRSPANGKIERHHLNRNQRMGTGQDLRRLVSRKISVRQFALNVAGQKTIGRPAPPVENFRARFQPRRHAVEPRLVFQTRDLAIVLGAARLDRA